MPLDGPAADILRWWDRPDIFVREVFGVTPDPWQDKVLQKFPTNQRQAMKAAKGCGKTGILSWLAWNFLCTRPQPKMAAVSISGENLSDNLWAEMAKWRQKSPLLMNKFEWTKTRIFCREAPETWFMSARTWPKTGNATDQANTLAGLHADYIMFLLDESGGIPDGVMATAEGALSSCIEGHIVQAGNPTHLEGPLYRACTSEARLWDVTEITGDPDDPMRSPRISIQWARDQIEKYGANSAWVLVNVFGRFPPASINSLIGPDDVAAAVKRFYREEQYNFAAKVLGVDVADMGDDQSVIFPRQGLVAFNPQVYRNITGLVGAGALARKWTDWDADAAFIDNTGGWSKDWQLALTQLGKTAIPVGFAEGAHDNKYFNRRAEMYFLLCKWVKDEGSIPDIPELKAALTATTYTFRGDKMLLEPKDSIKEKLGYSPDHADALALTFAEPVTAKPRNFATGRRQNVAQMEYDPLASLNEQVAKARSDYNPFG